MVSIMTTGKLGRPVKLSCMERGPGPGKYCLPGTCGKEKHDPTKHSRPAYSFGVKLNQSKDHKSPGPVYFIPPNTTRRGPHGAPSYSIKPRRPGPSAMNTPGPSGLCALHHTNAVYTQHIGSVNG